MNKLTVSTVVGTLVLIAGMIAVAGASGQILTGRIIVHANYIGCDIIVDSSIPQPTGAAPLGVRNAGTSPLNVTAILDTALEPYIDLSEVSVIVPAGTDHYFDYSGTFTSPGLYSGGVSFRFSSGGTVSSLGSDLIFSILDMSNGTTPNCTSSGGGGGVGGTGNETS